MSAAPRLVSNGGPPRAPRVMPHNAAVEASVLGGVILRNDVLAHLGDLETDDFYELKHKVVWQAIRNLEARLTPIDVVTLETEIEKVGKLDAIGGVAFLGELTLRVPTVDNVLVYRDEVRLLARHRRAIEGISEALDRAFNWPHDPADLISEIAGELQRIDESGRRKAEPTYQSITMSDALDRLATLQRAPVFTTPFHALNAAIGFGGLIGTQVYTVAAGTGRGKTSFVAELAAHATEQLDCPCVVSIHELGPEYFVARRAAGRLGVHSNDIIRGTSGNTRAQIMGALPPERLMSFLQRPTLRGLRDCVDDVAQKFGRAPLVIVDYLQKLADEIAARQSRPDLRMATSEASQALLEIGERTGAAILAVSSIGRGKKALETPRKFRPYQLVEVAKESGQVEYDGAGMIVLSLSDDMDGEERVATITLAKARFGREVHIDARYHGARGSWRDIGEVSVVEKVVTPKPATPAVVEEVREDKIRAAIVAELQKAPAFTKTSLVERVRGCRKEGVRMEVGRMLGEGLLVMVGKGVNLSDKGRQLVIEVAQ